MFDQSSQPPQASPSAAGQAESPDRFWEPGPGGLPLSRAASGCLGRICRHHAQGAIRQRLLDMGFVPEAEVEVMRLATLGDPMEVRVGDTLVTLRKREADLIEISLPQAG